MDNYGYQQKASGGYDLPQGGHFVNGFYYFAVPKDDGGYDFYKASNDQIVSVGQQDWTREQAATEGAFSDAYGDWSVDEQGNPYLVEPSPIALADMSQEPMSTAGGGTPTQTASPEQLSAALAAYNAQKSNIGMQRGQGLSQIDQYLQQQGQQENTLGVQKGEGLTGNQSYFNSISPDAFQSQIGNYNQKVLTAYNEGMNTVSGNKQRINTYKTDLEKYYTDLLTSTDADYAAQQAQFQQSATPLYQGTPNIQNYGINPASLAANAPSSPLGAQNVSGYLTSRTPEEEALMKYLGYK